MKDAKVQKKKDPVKMAEAGKQAGMDTQTSTKEDMQVISGRLDNLAP